MIKGFWGNHEVSFKASEDLNFLIGPNGSGKSTTLKIISGVLRADKDYLSELDFESVRINLKDPRSKRKPYIEVVKNLGVPFFHCDYKIVESSTEKPYGRSEVTLYFRSTSALAAFESGPSIKIDQVTRSVLRFWPPRAPRSSHFPHYRCTFPAVVSKCRRAIHRFDSANSVTS
ncbi:AAA family ATPase [Pseudomonas aeruginosa]